MPVISPSFVIGKRETNAFREMDCNYTDVRRTGVVNHHRNRENYDSNKNGTYANIPFYSLTAEESNKV
jgi:hypothetical protein